MYSWGSSELLADHHSLCRGVPTRTVPGVHPVFVQFALIVVAWIATRPAWSVADLLPGGRPVFVQFALIAVAWIANRPAWSVACLLCLVAGWF